MREPSPCGVHRGSNPYYGGVGANEHELGSLSPKGLCLVALIGDNLVNDKIQHKENNNNRKQHKKSGTKGHKRWQLPSGHHYSSDIIGWEGVVFIADVEAAG